MQTNRLTILHLLLWMLGTACALAAFRIISVDWNRTFGAEGGYATVMIAAVVAQCLLLGACVASVPLCLIARGQGRFPTEPGHYLLVVGGSAAIAGWTGYLSLSALAGDIAEAIPFELVQTIGISIAAWRMKLDTRPWQAGFWFLAAAHAALLVLLTLVLAEPLLPTAAPTGRDYGDSMNVLGTFLTAERFLAIGIWVVIAAAATVDSRRAKRDLLHWIGVIASLGPGLVRLATYWILAL